MKKWFLVVAACCFCLTANAQIGKWFEKRNQNNILDFQSKTTKIVLPQPDSMIDLLLRQAIEADWFLSPYEFCSWEDFERLKSDSSYYFLIRTNGQYQTEKEPSMEFLTLLKGDPAANEGIGELPEVLSLPLQSLQDTAGRIFPFLPAYVRIIQSHIVKVIRENRNHFSGLNDYADGMDGNNQLSILFEQDDFASTMGEEELQELFGGKARMATADEIDAALAAGTPNTCVSLVLYPLNDERNGYCYKMIVRADTYELLFYRKHKISNRNRKGFLTDDIRRLAVPYSF